MPDTPTQRVREVSPGTVWRGERENIWVSVCVLALSGRVQARQNHLKFKWPLITGSLEPAGGWPGQGPGSNGYTTDVGC